MNCATQRRPHRSILLLAASLSLLTSIALRAQTPQTIPGSAPAEPEGPTLGEIIGTIAESQDRTAVDYHQLAEMTLQLGQASMQQGQALPDSTIWDGIHAVDTGDAIDPSQADWPTLRAELEKLLEKPPEQPQDQQSEQNQQDRNQDNSESQENSQNEDSQGESGDSQSEQNQDSSQQDPNDPSDSSEERDGEDSKTEQDPSGDQESQNERQEGDDSQQNQPQTNQTLGDMEDEPQPEPQSANPREPEEQNQIGGTQQEQPIRSAKQAMTMQQLEQLRQQDKPGALHMLLQQAERSEQAPQQNKNLKDW